MSDEYDLKVLLELREREQEEAEDDYAKQVAELQRREEFVERKQGELRRAVANRKEACERHDRRVRKGEATMAEMRTFESYVDGLKDDERRLREAIERARTAVEQQKGRVAEAKEALIEATRDLKAVEKHRENWLEERETHKKRKKSAAMDDIAARRWMEENK